MTQIHRSGKTGPGSPSEPPEGMSPCTDLSCTLKGASRRVFLPKSSKIGPISVLSARLVPGNGGLGTIRCTSETCTTDQSFHRHMLLDLIRNAPGNGSLQKEVDRALRCNHFTQAVNHLLPSSLTRKIGNPLLRTKKHRFLAVQTDFCNFATWKRDCFSSAFPA